MLVRSTAVLFAFGFAHWSSNPAVAWDKYIELGPTKREIGHVFGVARQALPVYSTVIPYPKDGGPKLGEGVDLLTHEKSGAVCVRNFEETVDQAQSSDGRMYEAFDQEMVDIATDEVSSWNAKGKFGGVSGSGSARVNQNTQSSRTTSRHILIGRASARAGEVKLVPKVGVIDLTEDFAKLQSTDIKEFRFQCGDGYVSSIVSGAELFIQVELDAFDAVSRSEISRKVERSVGIGQLFGGGTENSIGEIVSKASVGKTSNITSWHSGGAGGPQSSDLQGAKRRYEEFTRDAASTAKYARSWYMTITPYRVPSSAPPQRWFSVAEDRHKAVRYVKRLWSLLDEAKDIEADYYRNRLQKGASADRYLYSYAHLLRTENPTEMREELQREIELVSSILRDLEGAACGASSSLEICNSTIPERSMRGKLCTESKADEVTCRTLSERAGLTDFDDLRFRLKFPLPVSQLSPDDLRVMSSNPNGGQDYEQKRSLFLGRLYDFHIQRIARARCSGYDDCLSVADRAAYRIEIARQLVAQAPPLTLRESSTGEPMDYVFNVQAGYNAKINIGYRDDNRKSTKTILYFRPSGSKEWKPYKEYNDFFHEVDFQAMNAPFEIGVQGLWCLPQTIGLMRKVECKKQWSAVIPGYDSPTESYVRYHDPGQTYARSWDLEVRVRTQAVP